jgi:hypothetical protein
VKVKHGSPTPAPSAPSSAPARDHARAPAPAPAPAPRRDSFQHGDQPWGPQIPQSGVASTQTADEGGHDWKGPRSKKELDEARKKLAGAKAPPLPMPPLPAVEQHSPSRKPDIVGVSQPETSDEGGHQQKPTEKPKPWFSWLLKVFR